ALATVEHLLKREGRFHFQSGNTTGQVGRKFSQSLGQVIDFSGNGPIPRICRQLFLQETEDPTREGCFYRVQGSALPERLDGWMRGVHRPSKLLHEPVKTPSQTRGAYWKCHRLLLQATERKDARAAQGIPHLRHTHTLAHDSPPQDTMFL